MQFGAQVHRLIPKHFSPSPVYPVGQGPHTAPTPGAGTSRHSTPSKHSISEHPFLSSKHDSPSKATRQIDTIVLYTSF